MNNTKFLRKARSSKKIRAFTNAQFRVLVYKSLKYDYLQLFDEDKKKIVASLSTQKITAKSRPERVEKLADEFSKILLIKKINKICFDRRGYKYHGRVKIMAETLRKNKSIF